jgi:hypothetical protein
VILAISIAIGVLAARVLGRGSSMPPRSAHDSAPAPPVGPAVAPSPVARWSAAPHEASVPQRELAPTDRRYNPLVLQREEEGTTIKEIFEREPRDPAFAPVLEQRAHAVLDRVFRELQLEGKIRGVQTECKTLSCYTFIEVDDVDVEQVYDQVNGIMVGDSQAPGFARATKGRPAGVTLYNLYRPDTRDDGYYQRFLEEAMQPALELSKQRHLKDHDAAGR